MAGPNNTELVLESGYISYGVWTNPHLIGTDSARPRSKFTATGIIGSIKRGTKVVDLPSEYVDAWVGTPQELFRRDPIKNAFTITGEIYEFNPEIWSVVNSRVVQGSYIVTTPASETWDIAHIGSRKDTIVARGWLIQTVDVFSREFEIAMYAGISTPTDQAVNLSGDDYAINKLMLEATPYPTGFTTIASKQKNYGYIARRTA